MTAQGESACKDTLLGDLEGGADVFTFADDQLYALAAAGALEPVDGPDKIADQHLPKAVEAASIENELYAYPLTADNGYFLYYDKEYFSEEDVRTLDQILKTAAENGKLFSMDWSSAWYVHSFFGGAGMEVGLNTDGITNFCTWNRTDGELHGTDVAQAMLDIASHPGFISTDDAGFLEGVQNGTIIAGVNGVWNAIAVEEAWGADYGAAKLPSYTCAGQQIQMSSFTGYKMMGVNAYSPHKEWAMKLADWLTNEENQYLRFVEKNQVPSNSNAAASDAAAQIPAVQAILEQSQYGNLQRVGVKYWDACTDFANIMIEGNPNNISLQQLMDTLTEGITASIAE